MKRLTFIFMGLLVIVFTVSSCAMPPSGQSDAGWVTLIDGTKGLENWNRVGTANWTASEGAVQADKSEKGSGFLVSTNSYDNFMIRVEFWVSDDANSGIFMRCADPQTITDKSCYEANVFDQRPDPSFGTGAIVHIAKVSPMPKAGGKWNTYEITAKGPRLILVLNGVQTVDVQDTKFARGPVALQWGRGVVKFRKVQIKPL
jgi:hypothetical protein